MAEEGEHTTEHQRYLDETATWAVATVCFVLLAISLLVEHIIHLVGKWLERKRKPALVEALEKVKAELMLLGFISLLLTILQEPISGMCISRKVAFTWRPCSGPPKVYPFGGGSASSGKDSCTTQGKVAFMTAYAIHQLHIFIFVLAIFHVLYCITTLALGTFKMRRWKLWENETKTPEHQYYNDPERFRFARETTFGRRHLHFLSKSPVTLWIVCFFRQFFGSVTKVDYLTLRHGFIIAHLTPENETRFDFQKYIHRSLEEDFKDVVGINPVIWFSAVLFLLSNAHGWYSYLWLPFIPLIVNVADNLSGWDKASNDHHKDGTKNSRARRRRKGQPGGSDRGRPFLVRSAPAHPLPHPAHPLSELFPTSLLRLEYVCIQKRKKLLPQQARRHHHQIINGGLNTSALQLCDSATLCSSHTDGLDNETDHLQQRGGYGIEEMAPHGKEACQGQQALQLGDTILKPPCHPRARLLSHPPPPQLPEPEPGWSPGWDP
ncbi:MLO-like protein 2 isoform X2 [Punica granatum]|uniref:MLO-like protein n=1 Tax=Punica granatum TaxID=22663 RepID=A0A6P8CMY2_PUNGR|nr:MLO-like protein 2 isoform X2 [Punica granatum]